MLYIIGKDRDGNEDVRGWHVGMPLPDIKARVMTFQADGDELDVIMHALREREGRKHFTKEV